MITKVRVVYFAFGAFLASLGMALPRALFSLIFVVAFAVLIEPKLPIGAKTTQEDRTEQAAILLGALIVIAIVLLIHRVL
jgi:hypothetical protein